jgi:hypothetical protein
LKAALDVLEGAFRFTTGVLAKGRQREVNLRVATVTAGIRGTDLWGRSRAKNEIVCLIEGQAEVGAEGEPAVTLDQPLQFYQRQEGRTQPVGFIAKQQLDQWASEVELEAGKGAARRDGGKRAYVVRIRSLPSKAEAQALAEQLRGRFGIDNPSVSG